MVDWARNGNFPQMLVGIQPNIIFATANTYQNDQSNLQRLFPPGPGTFSSYATNNARLGYVVHRTRCIRKIHDICLSLINGNNINIHKDVNLSLTAILPLFPLLNRAIDTQLAIVLFILDICDTAEQIFDMLDTRHNTTPIAGYQLPVHGVGGTRNNVINSQFNEYACRPVSATSTGIGGMVGDCAETMYRHLINIATQNDENNRMHYNIGHLPAAQLRQYYIDLHNAGTIVQTVTVQTKTGEAGLTRVQEHKSWRNALFAAAGGSNITDGTINNIIQVLAAIRPPNMSMSNLNANPRTYGNTALIPTTPISQGGAPGGTNQRRNASAIEDALNALDGRCRGNNNHSRRFIVSVNDDMAIINAISGRSHNTNLIIQIADKLWNHTITIATTTTGHAEIISI